MDYIICGGGTAGCVLVSRLKQSNPTLSVALIGKGKDERKNPVVSNPMGVPQLDELGIVSKFKTEPQSGLGNRQIELSAGDTLSGWSAINYGLWCEALRAARSGRFANRFYHQLGCVEALEIMIGGHSSCKIAVGATKEFCRTSSARRLTTMPMATRASTVLRGRLKLRPGGIIHCMGKLTRLSWSWASLTMPILTEANRMALELTPKTGHRLGSRPG